MNPFTEATMARPLIEVQPCRVIGGDTVEACAEIEADFFGVYQRDETGIATWLVDFKAKVDAESYATSLRRSRP